MVLGRFLKTAAALLLASFAAAVSAQETSGALSGTVVDQQGAALPGVSVTATNERTRSARAVVSDARGAFQLPALPPGTYTVKLELQSFRPLEHKGVVLHGAERLSLGELKLSVGLGEAVVVEASGTPVNTEETQHSGLITAKQIEQVAVKGRDVTTLMRLLPGVRYEDTVESQGESFGTDVPHVSGGRRTWNHITVDGVLGNEIGQTDKMAQQINLDSVSEVKILLNTFRAEFGRTGGAQIQIISKGGDAEYRGSAYYYGRHEKFNANNFFNNRAGRDRPRYRFNTYGANFSGPIPGFGKDGDKKLFFFYSIEAPMTEKPGSLLQWTMPTEAERRGDFSQTLNSAGGLIFIKDPLSPLACNVNTGGPGCFPGNIVPQARINRQGLALLNILPQPNTLDRNFTRGQFNHQSQVTNNVPKMNNIFRVDWRPSAKDSLYVTLKDWTSDQKGVGGGGGITAGPSGWGWFNAHYDNTDRTYSASHTHIFSSTLVNEAQAGARRQSENFRPVGPEDLQRLQRGGSSGYTLGQFHPEVNPLNILPKVNFNVSNSPNFTYDNRVVGDGGVAWVHSFNDNLTWIRSNHTWKAGLYFEHLKNTEGKGFSAPSSPGGQFDFSVDTNNPLESNYSFANLLLGNYRTYGEIDALPEVNSHRYMLETYLQDTWKVSRRVTLDLGVRLLWFKPWYTQLPAATFVKERYDLARAPRLYQPARINNTNVAFDPVTGQTLPNVFVGSFVPGTGDPYNGMVRNTDPDYPKGFRNNQGLMPEPRVGFAWDVTGDGKTGLHGGVGLFHNAHATARSMDDSAANPPAVNSPQLVYGSMDTLLQSGPAFSLRPSSVASLERDAKTPSSYQWSLGIQRDIGWGTVVDLTYVGWVARHMEQYTNINVVPDGAKFVDRNPQNANPQNPATAKPDDFLRPYPGYGEIIVRSNFGTANYNGLQVQLNRRYIHGLQFAVSYTYSKSMGITDADESQVSIARPLRSWHYAPNSPNQLHNLVINYTWDIPKATKLWNNPVVKLLFDDWQLSGENAFASGDWGNVFMTTTDNFDFTGGTGGNAAAMPGAGSNNLRVVRPTVTGDVRGDGNVTPDASGNLFNAGAFGRPARGEYGNASRLFYRLPPIDNWNLAVFKNFPLGANSKRRLQLRVEGYNVLNHTQFSAIDNTARFDPSGAQVNTAFGKATAARNPRILVGSARFSF